MMGVPLPTCQEMTELVTDFEEGALSFTASVQFRIHMMMCGPCRDYIEQMRLTARLVSTLPNEPAPLDEEVKETLLGHYRDWLAEVQEEDSSDS